MKSYLLLVLVGVLLVGTSNSSKSRQKRFLLLRKLIQMNREIGEQMDGINNQTPAPKSCPASYIQPVQYEQTTYYNNPPSQQEYYTTPSYNSHQDYYTSVPPPAYYEPPYNPSPKQNNYISSPPPPNYKEPPIPSYVQMSSSYISVSPDYIPEQNYPASPILGRPQSSYQSPTISRYNL